MRATAALPGRDVRDQKRITVANVLGDIPGWTSRGRYELHKLYPGLCDLGGRLEAASGMAQIGRPVHDRRQSFP